MLAQKLYTKVIKGVQHDISASGGMEKEVQTSTSNIQLQNSSDHTLLDGKLLDGQAEVLGSDDGHIHFEQKKLRPP